LAITKSDNVILLAAAADDLPGMLRVQSIRVVTDGNMAAGDQVILTESSSAAVMWETVAAGANYTESDSNGGKGFSFRNGLKVGTLENAKVYLYL